ncbi:MAG: hypothetical protein V3W20_08330 [Candidatus Neomarinimicrobiota bacterium]
MLKNRSEGLGRPPRLGKIKVGEKTEGGHPTSVDYFIIDSEYKDLVTKVYGEKPKVINIVFPSDNIEDNLNEMYRWYGKSGLKCTGNGETFTQFIDSVEEPKGCPCFRADENIETKPQCHASMIMSFIITGIGVTGIWHFTSKAVFSRSGIRAIMEMVQATTGKLAGVPFFLRVEMQESTISGNPNKFPVVSIDCAMDLEALMKQNLQIGAAETKILPEPHPSTVSDDKSKEIEPEPDKSEQKAKFSPLVQAKWDEFDKYLNDNKDTMDEEVHKTTREWLDTREDPTTKYLVENLSKLQEKLKPKTTGEYKQHHESLITACCDTLKTKDRLPVIQTLNIMVNAWKIEGLEKLSETTENQCLNLLEEFDKQQVAEQSDNLPY